MNLRALGGVHRNGPGPDGGGERVGGGQRARGLGAAPARAQVLLHGLHIVRLDLAPLKALQHVGVQAVRRQWHHGRLRSVVEGPSINQYARRAADLSGHF